jgi:hypothetical protein
MVVCVLLLLCVLVLCARTYTMLVCFILAFVLDALLPLKEAVNMCAVFNPFLRNPLGVDAVADQLVSSFPWWDALWHVLLLSVYEETPVWSEVSFTSLQLFHVVWARYYPPLLFIVHDVPLTERWFLMHCSSLLGRQDFHDFIRGQPIYVVDGALLPAPLYL